MALSFYKLHLAASSALVVDRSKKESTAVYADTSRMEDVARILLNRHCGAGGRALVCIDDSWPVAARAFGPDGRERAGCEDAWLCAARLAFDAGRVRSRTVTLSCPDGQRRFEALASGTLATSLSARASLGGNSAIRSDFGFSPALRLDDAHRARGVRIIPIETRHGDVWVVLSPAKGPGPRSLYRSMKTALKEELQRMAAAGTRERPALVWAQVRGRELVRFLCPLSMERLEAAVAASRAAGIAGLSGDSLVAEWAGPCGAVRYGTINAESPRELVTRGRFWARMEDEDQVLIAGSPEYAFEGSFERD